MANPEHLRILKEGVEGWNRWREEYPDICPDIAGADLRGAQLAKADFRFAALRNSKFSDANLVLATFQAADLRGADFGGAEFKGYVITDLTQNLASGATRLICADFSSANLEGANLGATDLAGAILSNANLKDADFREANFGIVVSKYHAGILDSPTTLCNVNLSSVRGLATINHSGPSAIGIDTLERTSEHLIFDRTRKGEILTFFRGAGVAESYIEFFSSQIGRPIEFFSCFISYSHTDQSFARCLHDQLQARGIRCWLDEHDLKPGDRILDVVSDAIRLHDKILLCCSESSLNSWWVKDEIRKAQDRERKEKRLIIIPLNLDGFLFEWNDGLASDLTSRLAADFTGWEHDHAKFEEQFERVVRALRTDDDSRRMAAKPENPTARKPDSG